MYNIDNMNSRNKIRVLFVEDDVDLAFIYSRIFENDLFSVVNAYNGEDGLILAKNEKPNIIVLDIMLPGINGLDVLKELKTSPSTMNIPVILLTNLSDETTIKEGFARQASGYLIKSYQNPQQVLDEVKEILKLKRSQ